MQYGFSEWPSAEFPLIAWMAGSQSGTAMLAPRPAPTVTRLSPFVNQTGNTARFSPNGDGVLDGAQVEFTLKAAATAVRLDVLNAAGAVVQSVALGPRAAGANSATWNGRLTGGAWAPAGSYLLRVTATDSAGADHAGPAASFSQAALGRWGVVADLVAPTRCRLATARRRDGSRQDRCPGHLLRADQRIVDGHRPAAGERRARGSRRPGHAGRQERHRDAAGAAAGQRDGPALALRPAARPGRQSGHPDRLGIPHRARHRLRALPRRQHGLGPQLGYAIAQDGDLRRLDRAMLANARSFRVGQRATVPNLPGRWLQVEAGPLAGMWVRESPTAYLRGFVERTSYPSGVQLRLRSAVHLGRLFTRTAACAPRAP